MDTKNWRKTKMRIVPDSTINLYAGVTIDNGEQLVFSSKQNQAAYFTSKLVRAETPCTVVKKTGEVKVGISMAIVSTCNYISFINPSLDNKVIYARIIDYDYVNNETTSISYAVDFWQTWMFDVAFDDMYIEREHLSEELWDLAEQNPYNPNIPEFRTSENLPITEDGEKLTYTFGTSLDNDGLCLQDVIEDELGVDSTLGVLVKISDIDFEDLDIDPSTGSMYPVADRPSNQFITWLASAIESEGMGFWALPWAMYEYLHAKYPSNINQNSFVGSDWGGLSPFTANDFRGNIMYIYSPNGGTGMSPLGWLLDRLVRWNCVSSIVDMHIIPNNIMLSAGVDIQSGGVLQANQKTVKTAISVTNKKLMMFPFSYLRIITPNGDVKELHFENFADVQAGYDVCPVGMVLDVSDKPNLIIAPYHYKMTGISNNALDDYNVHEGVYFKQFPTAPYNIDAFLAQVANVSYETIANSTGSVRLGIQQAQDLRATQEREHYASLGSKIVGTAASAFSGAGSTIGGAVGNALTGIGVNIGNMAHEATFALQNEQQRENLWRQEGMINDARKIATAKMSRGADGIASEVGFTRPAFAADKYTPSNGVGTSNYNVMCTKNVLYQRVTLNPTVLGRYDAYFTHYGYASGRCGIPRVINYMHGMSQDTPHWLTVNGRDTTYVKTVDCKVTHSMVAVAEIISEMFNGGVRMIKGDAS